MSHKATNWLDDPGGIAGGLVPIIEVLPNYLSRMRRVAKMRRMARPRPPPPTFPAEKPRGRTPRAWPYGMGWILRQVSPGAHVEISRAYWETDLNTFEICDVLGISRSDAGFLSHWAGPRFLRFGCVDCDGLIAVTGRAGLRSLMHQVFREPSFLRESDVRCLCAKCAKAREMRERAQRERCRKEELSRRDARLVELKRMPYGDYLRSPEWQETRGAALKRAGYRCSICSAPGGLDVHHRTYVRRGAEYARDVTVLCRSCHTTFHENGRLAEGGRAP